MTTVGTTGAGEDLQILGYGTIGPMDLILGIMAMVGDGIILTDGIIGDGAVMALAGTVRGYTEDLDLVVMALAMVALV